MGTQGSPQRRLSQPSSWPHRCSNQLKKPNFFLALVHYYLAGVMFKREFRLAKPVRGIALVAGHRFVQIVDKRVVARLYGPRGVVQNSHDTWSRRSSCNTPEPNQTQTTQNQTKPNKTKVYTPRTRGHVMLSCVVHAWFFLLGFFLLGLGAPPVTLRPLPRLYCPTCRLLFPKYRRCPQTLCPPWRRPLPRSPTSRVKRRSR